MRRRFRIDSAKALCLILPFALAAPALAVNCTTESQMNAAQRGVLEQAARGLAANIQTGNTAAVREQTIAAVAAQFGGIAQSIQNIDPSIQGGTVTIDALYMLDASDLKAAGDTQFFCGVAGSPLTVEITIPGLPPGKYALAILHATGVKQPQQLSLVLANDPAGSQSWKLAGFFAKPLLLDSHDGVWFWRQARAFAAKKADFSAWFYYQSALFLLEPVDFISSPNLEKLNKEAEKARPDALPGIEPLHLNTGTQTVDITNLYTGMFGDNLDLQVDYRGTPGLDPVAARAQVMSVMRALLQQHPDLREGFHGLWVHAMTADNQQTFALELPMDQITGAAPAAGQGY